MPPDPTSIITIANSPSRTPARGRQRELRSLGRSITATAAGQGSVVVVEGGAGLGKSRILAEAARIARTAGMDVAAGQVGEGHRSSPLVPILAALQVTLPSKRGRISPAVSWLSCDSDHLVDELTEVLQERVRTQPVLISFDDLHRADPLTLFGVQTLVQRLSDLPVMWLLSRRRSPSTPLLHGVLTTLTAAGATTAKLAPLTADAVRELATDLLGVAPSDALLVMLAKCSGNPFLVTELIGSLAERDQLVIDTTDARLLPTGASGHLYQRITAGLAALRPLTREFLEVAAIFGTSFDVICVARIMHRTVAELLPAVHEALDTEWLAEDGGRLAFRHRLVREAAYAALPSGARKTLHREAAAALLANGGAANEVAAHVVKGAAVGTVHAVGLLVDGSDELASTAPGPAADLRLRAVELMAPDDLDRHRRIGEVIGLLVQAGRPQEAAALGETALQVGLPVDLEAQLRCRLAEALSVAGRPDAALQQTRIALHLPGLDASAQAHLLAVESTAHLLAGDIDAALRTGAKALSTADAGGSAEGGMLAAGRALVSTGAAERMQGRLGKSLETIEQAALLVSAGTALAQELEPAWSRGRTLITLDRLDEAAAVFQAATQRAEQHGRALSTVFGHTCRATVLLYQGALDDSIAEGGTALRKAEDLAAQTVVPELSAVLAEASAYRGRLDGARSHLRRGLDLAARGAGIPALSWASSMIAETSGQEPGRVLELAADLYEHSPGRMQLLAMNPTIGPRLVSFALRADDRRRATLATQLVESLSRSNPMVSSLAAAAQQARGLLDGDTDRLVRAARTFQASSRPLAQARADEDAAQALLRDERFPQAVDHFMLALGLYERAGAHHHAQRLRDRLSTLRTPAHQTSFGWPSLTPAERRVARLVADGLTNRAIADELSLSPHTVESHLRHSFHKLDIRSRVELTRIVLQHEPTIDT